ncbi:MAG: DUF1772 domain-containing protein [Gemmatimonadales bacterium]|nr:DUF1772 domain-containing protein [Gemmatimonadales bacterium]
MDQLILALSIAALLGSALVAGVFFAFSSFVMKALARLPATEGVAAMQSINVVVINRSFLGVFIGTAVLSLGMVVVAVLEWGTRASLFHLGGAVLYLVGTFLVTGVRNVPLNDELAALSPDQVGERDTWDRYLRQWTVWNHVRTIAALLAALSYCLGLLAGAA